MQTVLDSPATKLTRLAAYAEFESTSILKNI